MDEDFDRTRESLIKLLRDVIGSEDHVKLHTALVQLQLYEGLQRLERGTDKNPGGDGMSWRQVSAMIAGIVIPVVGVFVWGHGDLSRDIDRLESSIGEVRADLSGFKDQIYERLADVQKQISDTRSDVANYRAEAISLQKDLTTSGKN